jgi:ATP-dependent DNA helicase RecQ
VLRLGLDKLSTYGISEKSEKQLREIINQLILSGYLLKTDDEYPVIKLGENANEILRNGGTVQMKLSKEKQQQEVTEKKQFVVRPVDAKLFAALRELRLAIASEQKVPAFVVFPDSALIDMCIKLPTTKEEFLKVSGVGQVKLERYGERFLGVISLHTHTFDPLPLSSLTNLGTK